MRTLPTFPSTKSISRPSSEVPPVRTIDKWNRSQIRAESQTIAGDESCGVSQETGRGGLYWSQGWLLMFPGTQVIGRGRKTRPAHRPMIYDENMLIQVEKVLTPVTLCDID